MSKIRINELARELEVKPNVIIDLLPELGVADKKTPSSSLEDDVVLSVRQRLAGGGDGATHEGDAELSVPPVKTPAQHAAPAASFEEAARVAPTEHTRPQVSARVEPAAPETLKETVEESAPARLAPPLRPPLATGSQAGPLTPTISRGASIPVKPAPPAPRPGQILSGPRQPMPPGVGETSRPAPAAVPTATIPGSAAPGPGAPRPVVAHTGSVPSIPTPRMAPPRPAGPSMPAAQQPTGGGGPLRPPAKPNLAGQPVARPTGPPRPDLVAKLAHRPATPTQPGAPRPGMPTRPARPVTGRATYRGSVRPSP